MLIVDGMRQLVRQDEALYDAEIPGPLMNEPAGIGVVEPNDLARQERTQRCSEVGVGWDHADRAPGDGPAVVERRRVRSVEALLDLTVHPGRVDRGYRDRVLVAETTHLFYLLLDSRDLR